MSISQVQQKAMYNRCMDLLIEVERQYGYDKVMAVAKSLLNHELISDYTYELLINDTVPDWERFI